MRSLKVGPSLFAFLMLSVSACGDYEETPQDVKEISRNSDRVASELERDREYLDQLTKEMKSLSESLAAIRELTMSLAKMLISFQTGETSENSNPGNQPRFTLAELQSLLDGKAVVGRSEVKDKPKRLITVFQKAEATPEEAIAVWTDFNAAPTVLPNIKSAKESGTDQTHIIDVAYLFHLAVVKENYTIRYTLEKPEKGEGAYRMGYVMTKADSFVENWGEVWFFPLKKGTLIASSGYLDTGREWLTEPLTIREMKDSVRRMVLEIETESKNSTDKLKERIKALHGRLPKPANP